jgi:hypothetical protein
MKLLITLFVFEAAVFMNAQPVKGSFTIGGTLMYSSNSTSITDTQTEIDGEYTRTGINIGPKIGFYVSDHFMLGFLPDIIS